MIFDMYPFILNPGLP